MQRAGEISHQGLASMHHCTQLGCILLSAHSIDRANSYRRFKTKRSPGQLPPGKPSSPETTTLGIFWDFAGV